MNDRAIEIREQIALYIESQIAADELESWLSSETADVTAGPAYDLALEALRLVAEYTDEAAPDDAELRERLGVLSRTYWFEEAPKTAWAGASHEIIRRGQFSAAAGRSREVGYA